MTATDHRRGCDIETVGRPAEWRMEPSLYPVSGLVTARYADMDHNAHLNNVALESMHEDARAMLIEQVFPGTHATDGAGTIRLVNAQSVVHYLAEAWWPCVIRTGVGVSRVGKSSFVLSSALFREHTCISLCDATVVSVIERPTRLSDPSRRALIQLRLRGFDSEGD